MDKYEEMRMLFIEYITKVQHGMKGRKELAIIDDYERISGRDFIKDRDDFWAASNNKFEPIKPEEVRE
jgi:hypothetical protein